MTIRNQQRVINFHCQNPHLKAVDVAFKMGLPLSEVAEVLLDYKENRGFVIFHSAMNNLDVDDFVDNSKSKLLRTK